VILPDYTISGDTVPIWQETPFPALPTYHPGVAQGSPPKPISQLWVQDAVNRRHGAYGIKVSNFRDSVDPYNANAIYTGIFHGSGRADLTPVCEGDEEWVGMSFKFPATWPGVGATTPGAWCTLYEWGSSHTSKVPSYGCLAFEAGDPNRFELRIKTGSRGAVSPDPVSPNGYDAVVVLLGTGGAPGRPFTKDVWHDFYYYMTYQARTNGILEVWHRQEGGAFVKIYSNKNDGTALINKAPHPTWEWNSVYGAPGENDAGAYVAHDYGIYCSKNSFNSTHDRIFWEDGSFRRQSQAAILAEFPSSSQQAILGFNVTDLAGHKTSVPVLVST